jgi:hypothetical protein
VPPRVAADQPGGEAPRGKLRFAGARRQRQDQPRDVAVLDLLERAGDRAVVLPRVIGRPVGIRRVVRIRHGELHEVDEVLARLEDLELALERQARPVEVEPGRLRRLGRRRRGRGRDGRTRGFVDRRRGDIFDFAAADGRRTIPGHHQPQ